MSERSSLVNIPAKAVEPTEEAEPPEVAEAEAARPPIMETARSPGGIGPSLGCSRALAGAGVHADPEASRTPVLETARSPWGIGLA